MTALRHTFDADRDGIVELKHIKDSEYPDGFLGVFGEFDDVYNLIELTFISNTNADDEFEFENEEAQKWFEKELDIAFSHEMIHREQYERGEDFHHTVCVTKDEKGYYGNPLEIEAYGRADVFKEVDWYDLTKLEFEDSVTHALYKNLFGADSWQVALLEKFSGEERGRQIKEKYAKDC